MKTPRIGLFFLMLTALGCARQPSDRQSLAGPSPVDRNVVYDSSVAWDRTELGRVVVTNPTSTPMSLTLIVWKYEADDRQFARAVSPRSTIQPGETKALTVGVALECGSRYQRDVYTGGPYGQGVTLSDVGNNLYAAPGALWTTPPCGQAPTPPVVVQPPPPTLFTCGDEGLIVTRQPYPTSGPRTRSVVATFTIGPAIIAWGDGSAEPILNGVVTTHIYDRAAMGGAIFATATVTTAHGCAASVQFET